LIEDELAAEAGVKSAPEQDDLVPSDEQEDES
jgi:hypothetical protein